MRTATLRRLALALTVPAAAAIGGCDAVTPGYTDTYGNIVHVVTFNFDLRDAVLSPDLHSASFTSDDIRSETARRLIRETLDEDNVTSDGLVMLYVEDDLFLGASSGTTTRWAALPHTEAFETTAGGSAVVDLVLSYAFSYDAGSTGGGDDGNLYFDINSSAPMGSGTGQVEVIPFLRDRLAGNSIRMKFVAIPRQLVTQSGLRAADLQSYETVARTFELAAE